MMRNAYCLTFGLSVLLAACERDGWYPEPSLVGYLHDDGCADLELDPMRAPPEVRIAPGSFEFGQSPEYFATYWDTVPRARVEVTIELSYPFYIDAVETTHGYWTSLMPFSGFTGPASCVECAESGVHFFDALLYANRRSEAAGLEACYNLSSCTFDHEGRPLTCDLRDLIHPDQCNGYRVPTRPEWVRAARAGTTSDFLCEGEGDPTDSLTGCMTDYAYVQSYVIRDLLGDLHFGRPVGKRCPNTFGLHDVYGNVAEWVYESVPLPEWWPADGAVDPRGPAPADLPSHDGIGQMGGGLYAFGGQLGASLLGGAFIEREYFEEVYAWTSGVRLVRTAYD